MNKKVNERQPDRVVLAVVGYWCPMCDRLATDISLTNTIYNVTDNGRILVSMTCLACNRPFQVFAAGEGYAVLKKGDSHE